MDDEVELISDGDGLAVIGAPHAVEEFLSSQGLTAQEFDLRRAMTVAGAVAGEATQSAAPIIERAGHWVKLSGKSAQQLKEMPAMKGSTAGLSRAVAMKDGKIAGILEFQKAGSLLTNPAVLAGVGGIMSQLANQAAMDEITDYLATIDAKVDDILRAQKDAVFADMIGVDFVIDEAMVVREHVGRVSEVTWSKVQSTAVTIARTQAYVLRQLDATTVKLEATSKLSDLVKASAEAESTTREWIAVLARCFQLQDAIAILEIDRVLDTTPEDIDQHRIGVHAARRNRIELITAATRQLMSRLDAAATSANAQALLHPVQARSVVTTSNRLASGVTEFQSRLGIDTGRDQLAERRWIEAAADARDRVLEGGAQGVDSARTIGTQGFVRARTATDRFALKLAEGAMRRRGRGEPDESSEQ